MTRYWTPAEDARLRELAAAGRRSPAIAAALGRTPKAVGLRAMRLGVPTPFGGVPDESRRRVVADRLAAGLTCTAVARELGLARQTVAEMARRLARCGDLVRTGTATTSVRYLPAAADPWGAYAASRSSRARNRLVEEYLYLADVAAAEFVWRVPPSVTRDELAAAAAAGILRAVETFDPGHGVPFDAYARRRARGSVMDYLRNNGLLGWKYHRRLKAGRQAAIGLTELTELTAPADRSDDPAAGLWREDVFALAGGGLDARGRDILRLYYAEGWTHERIGRHLGVAESRVSQLHTAALAHARERLAHRREELCCA